MELSQELLIDVALNAAGFLIAGLLGLTLYSIIKHKEKESTQPIRADSNRGGNEFVNSENNGLRQNRSHRKMEFVDLSAVDNSQQSYNPKINRSEDRAKLLMIADTMVRSGADLKQILKVLPISENELLALVKKNQK